MTETSTQNAVKVGKYQFGFPKNSDYEKTGFAKVDDYFKSSNGAFRIFQLMARVCRAIAFIFKDLGNHFTGWFDLIADRLTIAYSALAVTRLPQLFSSLQETISNWNSPPVVALVNSRRALADKVHNIADACSTVFYTIVFFTGDFQTRLLGEVTGLVSDATDFFSASKEYVLSTAFLRIAKKEHPQNSSLHLRFQQTITAALLQLTKIIATVASTALGLGVYFFGLSVNQGIFLSLGLVSVFAAIGTHFYKVNMPMQRVEFNRPIFWVEGRCVL